MERATQNGERSTTISPMELADLVAHLGATLHGDPAAEATAAAGIAEASGAAGFLHQVHPHLLWLE
jgi:hypothetical protein